MGHIVKNCQKKKQDSNNNNNNNNNQGTANVQTSEENNNNNNNQDNSKTAINQVNIDESNREQSFCFLQSSNNRLRDWMLLDNQSTANIFCNPRLLKNIRSVNESITVKGNGGALTTNKKGYLPNFGDVWYDDRAITNILSLDSVAQKYRVTYDSEGKHCFTVHKPDELVHFNRAPNGLYYHDTLERDITLLNTVEDNKSKFSARQVQRAEVARKVYRMVGYPSIKDFKGMISHNLIANCPVTIKTLM